MFQPSTPPEETIAPISADEMQQAQKQLGANKNAGALKTPIFPVPTDAPECQFKIPALGGAPTIKYPYHSYDGKLLGYMGRWDLVNETTGERTKEMLPITFCKLPNGNREWRSKGMQKPYPLYNARELIERPNAPVVVHEGEKSAEAGKLLFPDYVSTTPMHGAKSPQHSDWSILKGRVVIICPDYDDAGESYGDAVYDLCMDAGAEKILHLPPEAIGRFQLDEEKKLVRCDEELPKGFDLADLLEEGWTARDVMQLDESELLRPYIKKSQLAELQESLGEQFRLSPKGVELVKKYEDEEGNMVTEYQWFCSYLAVTYQTRDEFGENWGCVLELIDGDGKRKEYVMPMKLMAKDGAEYREELLSRGLKLAPRANQLLHSYITMAAPKARALCVQKPGWHQQCFILPHKIYGAPEGERIVLQQASPAKNMQIRGTLEQWQATVGQACFGNDRLMVALCAGFAAPLLHLLGEENFILHYAGGSSIGKTTALLVTSSMYGTGVGSWRTTDNAAESLARQANDTVILLDELSQVDGFSADAMAYMLGNGAGKSRANRNGNAKPVERFRLIALSSGETGLESKMQEVGRSTKAGQGVRFIEIPADAGVGYGIFNTIHDAPNSNQFAVQLKSIVQECTGALADSYLTRLTESVEEITTSVADARKKWADEHVNTRMDGQIQRVGHKFALLAAAGELGIALGLLPWPKDSASEACARLFEAWVAARGSNVAHELLQAEKRLRLLIAEHGNSRFEAAWGGCDDDSPMSTKIYEKTINRAGFRKLNDAGEWEYYITPAIFNKEVVADANGKAVKHYLAAQGLIRRDNQGKFSIPATPPGHKTSRYIHVTAKAMQSEDDDAN